MKKILSGIIIFLFTLNTFAENVVYMENFSVTQVGDVTPCIYNALQSVQNLENVKLVFPKGVYHFYPDKAFGKYHCATNHDNGFRYFAFPIIGYDGIEIDGQGSEFIFHGQIIPFLIEKSNNVTIKNITVDWEIPFFIQGLVVDNNQEERSIDIEIPKGYPDKLEGNRLYIAGEGWQYPFLGANLTWDTSRNAVIYRAFDYKVLANNRTSFKAQELAKNKYRVWGKFSRKVPPVGSIIVFSGLNNGENRTSPAFHSSLSSNVKLENINVHHAGGMGFIAERSENIHVNNFNVVRRKDNPRMVTTTADATHFCGCRGTLLIENCTFENMLDDATNVHGTYLRIDSIIDSRTLMAKLIHYQQFGYDFADQFDTIQFIEAESLQPLGLGEVKHQEKINNRYYKIVFREDLPKNIKSGDGLENITWYPICTFRNNVVRNNRARSILISTKNRCIIENNSFSSMMSGILIEGDLHYWHEAGAVNDVIIRNNTFLDGGYGGSRFATIWINPKVKPADNGACYERNIRITNNVFRTYDNPILNAYSVDNLVFENNIIQPSGTFEPIWKDTPFINISHSKNVNLRNNSYKGEGKALVVVDSISRKSTSIKKMQGFNVEK